MFSFKFSSLLFIISSSAYSAFFSFLLLSLLYQSSSLSSAMLSTHSPLLLYSTFAFSIWCLLSSSGLFSTILQPSAFFLLFFELSSSLFSSFFLLSYRTFQQFFKSSVTIFPLTFLSPSLFLSFSAFCIFSFLSVFPSPLYVFVLISHLGFACVRKLLLAWCGGGMKKLTKGDKCRRRHYIFKNLCNWKIEWCGPAPTPSAEGLCSKVSRDSVTRWIGFVGHENKNTTFWISPDDFHYFLLSFCEVNL